MTTYCGVCSDFDQWDFMEQFGHFHECNDLDTFLKVNDLELFQENIDEYIRQILIKMQLAGIHTEIRHDVIYDTILVYD